MIELIEGVGAMPAPLYFSGKDGKYVNIYRSGCGSYYTNERGWQCKL